MALENYYNNLISQHQERNELYYVVLGDPGELLQQPYLPAPGEEGAPAQTGRIIAAGAFNSNIARIKGL